MKKIIILLLFAMCILSCFGKETALQRRNRRLDNMKDYYYYQDKQELIGKLKYDKFESFSVKLPKINITNENVQVAMVCYNGNIKYIILSKYDWLFAQRMFENTDYNFSR